MLKDLIQQPESKTLEFKRDLSSPRPVLKTLVAFANSAGGRLVLGVTDDRQVIGVANPLDEEERLANMIADSITPRLVPNVEMVTVEGKTLLVVEVFLSGTRPHFLKAEGMENWATNWPRLCWDMKGLPPLPFCKMKPAKILPNLSNPMLPISPP